MVVKIAAFALIMFLFWLADRIRSNRRTVRPAVQASPPTPPAVVVPADPCPDPGPDPAPRRRSAPLVDVVPSDPCPARRTAPIDVSPDPDPDPDPESEPEPEVDPMPYNGDRCWGCSKRCTYRAFRLPEGGTRDEIHRRAEILYRAEHGCASDLDQIDGSDVARVSLSAEELDFDPIAVAKAVGESKRRSWFELCEQCVDDMRARRDNPPDPIVEPAAVVAAECPF